MKVIRALTCTKEIFHHRAQIVGSVRGAFGSTRRNERVESGVYSRDDIMN